MLIKCEKCAARFEVDERKMGPGKRKLRCSFCHAVFYAMAPQHQRPPLPADDIIHEEEMDPEENPELMGTMILSTFNKPKRSDHPPPPPPPSHQHTGPEDQSHGHDAEEQQPVNIASRVRRVIIPPGRKAEILHQSKWISEMAWDEVKLFAQFWELYRIAPGTSIFQQGDRNANIGLIIKGTVTIGFDDGDEYDPELAILGPGKSMGELSLVDDQPRASNAVATTECFILILTKKRSELMADKYPRLWRQLFFRIARLMSRRIRVAGGRLVDFLEK